jgi:hypothetical protein
MPIAATACGAVQHKRFFIYRSRANPVGSAHASEAATDKQKILCHMGTRTSRRRAGLMKFPQATTAQGLPANFSNLA